MFSMYKCRYMYVIQSVYNKFLLKKRDFLEIQDVNDLKSILFEFSHYNIGTDLEVSANVIMCNIAPHTL